MRTGRNRGNVEFDLGLLRDVFRSQIESLEDSGYLQEAFGKWCPDADDNLLPGSLGRDIEVRLMIALRKRNLWPVAEHFRNYTEDDIFDLLEFVYDHVSKPVPEEGWFHSFCGCGWHYSRFTKPEAQAEFRATVNEFLRDYGDGFELLDSGEIVRLLPHGIAQLVDTKLPTRNELVQQRLASAIEQYRRRGASHDDRRIAVRELADILENLKKTAVSFLDRKDESDLFNLVNNFGIRHANESQKTNYDPNIWLSWMFHFLLATIHACIRLEEKSGSK